MSMNFGKDYQPIEPENKFIKKAKKALIIGTIAYLPWFTSGAGTTLILRNQGFSKEKVEYELQKGMDKNITTKIVYSVFASPGKPGRDLANYLYDKFEKK